MNPWPPCAPGPSPARVRPTSTSAGSRRSQGADRILVQLPGLSAADQESAKSAITRAAFLTFHLVSPSSDQDCKDHVAQPGYEIMKRKETMRNGQERWEEVEIRKRPEMDGSGIKSAMVVRGNLGEPEIHFTLDSEGADTLRRNHPRHTSMSAWPSCWTRISTPPPSSRRPSRRAAARSPAASTTARPSSWPTSWRIRCARPCSIIESREVDPTLGKDSIRSGIRAAIYGTLAVSAFMLVYYLVAGMVANVALIANIIILLGVMCSIGTTLTLPGIAGIVLTVGMAVDANVLIYERIREETAKGKSLRGAIAAGYARAFGTIFDSHVTTLISSVILMYMGTGSIKGFGVALTIGVAASLFTALVVTRMIFDWLLDRGWLKSIPMLHFIRATKLDFMRLAKPAFAVSWILIAIGCGYGWHRGKAAFGVDFLGGDTTTFTFTDKVGEAVVRSALTKAGIKDPLIQYQMDLSSRRQTLRVVSATDTGNKVVSV